MDSLPPELHSLIIEFTCACPHAFRAMSLTNTYFHAITASFRFHTVTLSSWEQAARLLPLLEATPAPKRTIRRLFLGPDLEFAPALALSLLRLAAPTLQDLALIFSSSCALLAAVFRIEFPRLKAMMVRGFYPIPRPGSFPALTHLHLDGNHSPVGVPSAILYASRSLAHLRISGLRVAPEFARELRDALDMDSEQNTNLHPISLAPNLQRISLDVQLPKRDQTNQITNIQNAEMR
ncbi:hypothetical protein MSAN_00618100 [Mycena sanguinolenta]|uniref:Uncharacterized protein n=1 Tax=Mycena sanguinolenta TaxID=230812 RepID=A0A8H6Z2Z8_9AGAR|nr:hypothetical protein MSAN_00618100 [Mycena sanguinolenta]